MKIKFDSTFKEKKSFILVYLLWNFDRNSKVFPLFQKAAKACYEYDRHLSMVKLSLFLSFYEGHLVVTIFFFFFSLYLQSH